jgi:hypothetical protein
MHNFPIFECSHRQETAGHDGIFDDCRHNRIETTQRLLSTIVANHSMKLSTVCGFATTTCFI